MLRLHWSRSRRDSRRPRRVSGARPRILLLTVALAAWASTTTVHAQHGDGHSHGPGPGYEEGDMIIGATAGPERRLAMSFDFTTPVRVTLADRFERLTVFTAVDPGFDALTGEERLDGLRALRAGTAVDLELVDDDDGRIALKVGDVLLETAGARAPLGVQTKDAPSGLHGHAEVQLRLAGAPGDWSEARLRFRLHASEGGYAPSEPHELLVSNAYLPAVAHDTAAPDGNASRCRRALVPHRSTGTNSLDELAAACAGLYQREQLEALAALLAARLDPASAAIASACEPGAADTLARLARQRARQLGRCLLAFEREAALTAAGGRVDPTAAARACASSAAWLDGRPGLLDRLRRAHRHALRRLRPVCERDVARAAVEAMTCASEDAVSALFPTAKTDLNTMMGPPEAIGRRLDEYFPCVRGSVAPE